MKQILLHLSMILLAFVLVACGGEDTPNDTPNEENQDRDDSNQQTEENQQNTAESDDMQQRFDELDYTKFELEVDYGENQEYEAEIGQWNDVITAELEDELHDEDIKGGAAFDKIYPFVEQLTIDKDTPKEEAIAEILDVFDLDDNYVEFEAEITFPDGVEIEFEDKK